ncbi:monocarboxylate transporter 5-like isoform X2 [Haemaphysalis longicornis]
MKNRVDSRWDLLVVMMMAGVFCTATYRSSGWFYVAYMEEFKVDRQGASWPGSVYKTAFRCAGLFVTALRKHLSNFWIGLIGGCLLWGGTAASVFAPNIAWMAVTIGFVHEAISLVSGTSGLLLVPLLFCNPLIMGYFRDHTGSYDGLFRLVAGIILSVATTFLAMIFCNRRRKSRKTRSPPAEA